MRHLSITRQKLSGAFLGLLGLFPAVVLGSDPPAAPEIADPLEVQISEPVLASLAARMQAGDLEPTGVEPRLIVFLCEIGGPLGERDPIEAPFYRRPQPIRSIELDLRQLVTEEGDALIQLGDGIDGVARIPDRLGDLQGEFHLRAVIDLGQERSHDAPGNPISSIVEAEYRPDRTDPVKLVIDDLIESERPPRADNLVWVDVPSPMLSRALGRSVSHRAGVALPAGYLDSGATRRFWPVVYVIPGFGGDERGAIRWAELLSNPAMGIR